LFYQTLVATWPEPGPRDAAWPEYSERLIRYMEKAMREAKINTSWANPDEEYEKAALGALADLLNVEKSRRFLDEVGGFAEGIADAGYVNSLSQVVLKMCMPGAPDFYQGTEFWDFSLVDPDNRRGVDFPLRRRLLDQLARDFSASPGRTIESLAEHWPDTRIKLLVTWRLLHLRRQNRDIFNLGAYIPLHVQGNRESNLIAFARDYEGNCVIAVAPRLVQKLLPKSNHFNNVPPYRLIDWKNTTIEFPLAGGTELFDVFTQEPAIAERVSSEQITFNAGDLLSRLPVAVLVSNQNNRSRS
jgi:(1->4)-alpha-D-glucan 1-alpha-D-glucosylmutase